MLRLIEMTCRGAATRGVPVSVCGGLAADPLAAPILVGLGVRTLSVPPARVPAIKALVARLTLPAVQDLAAAALLCRQCRRGPRPCPTFRRGGRPMSQSRFSVMSFLQPLGRALMLPIAVLPVAGLLLRLGQPDL